MAGEYHGHYMECTGETMGTVVDLCFGSSATAAVVEYEVDGKTYQIKETLIYKHRAIKIGFLPIGMVSEPVMGSAQKGAKVQISYKPENPQIAFLTLNRRNFKN